ncbi:hypothetical protein [Streptomyces sp. NPDC002790]|uniref:hypothetical protein n=1 Tax=Streptomyces sp. NPDC002790 TaxID=3154431 RepID=UPI003333828F
MRQLSVSQRALSLSVLRLGRLAATTVAVAAAAGCMSVGADGGGAPTHSPPQRGSGAVPDGGGAAVPDGGADVGARGEKAAEVPSGRPASSKGRGKGPATPSSAAPKPTRTSVPPSAPTSPSRSASHRPTQRPSPPSATSTPSPTKSSPAPSSSPPTAEPSSSAHEETASERASEPRPQAGSPA